MLATPRAFHDSTGSGRAGRWLWTGRSWSYHAEHPAPGTDGGVFAPDPLSGGMPYYSYSPPGPPLRRPDTPRSDRNPVLADLAVARREVHHGIPVGADMSRFAGALAAGPTRSLDDLCDSVLARLGPLTRDDTALLLARTTAC
jgi:hypothetical protein